MSIYAKFCKVGFSADGGCAYVTLSFDGGVEESLCLLSDRYAELVRGRTEFTREEYDALLFESEYSRALLAGMRSLSCSPSTRKEIFQKLRKKHFSDEVSSLAADYFCDNGYIKEKEQLLCEIKCCIKKKYGPLKIKSRLISKGFPTRLIEKGMQKLDGYDFTENCRSLALKKGLCDPFDPKERSAMYKYLSRNGYTSECIKSVLSVLYADVY